MHKGTEIRTASALAVITGERMDDHTEKLKKVNGYDHVLITLGCENELKDLYKRGSSECKNFEKWLDRKLKILETGRLSDLLEDKRTFEDLGEYVLAAHLKLKLYSIRRQHHEGNPRILFTYLSDESGHAYILLTAFSEIQMSDYTRAIEKSRKRLMNIWNDVE